MILYDDKHNFLGMSSHTLGFLGYEDISEFLSLNNDFANLFVNKEGYIYKFDNFAWIDFVLYSGSANKSAIITLKSGQETQVDLSIKEVFLTHPIGDIKKLYSVKLISNSFHEISGTSKTTNSDIGAFSLSGLVKKEPSIDEKAKIESEKVEFENKLFESNQQQKEDKSFILNIDEDQLTEKEAPEAPLKTEDLKIDLFKEEQNEPKNQDLTTNKLPNDQPNQTIDFLKNNNIEDQNRPEQQEGFTLLKDEKQNDKNDEEQPTQEQNIESTNSEKTEKKESGFLFDFLKIDDQTSKENSKDEITPPKEQNIQETETKSEPEIELGFLSKDSIEQEVEEPIEKKESGFLFDFLKIDDQTSKENPKDEITPPKEQSIQETETKSEPEIELGFISMDSLNDKSSKIKEEEPKKETLTEPKSEFKLDFLNIPKTEQTEQNTKTDQTEAETKKSKIIQQIKEDIKEIDGVSETNQDSIPQKELFKLQVPDTPQTKQPEPIIEKDIEADALKYDEGLPNFQIQESKDLDNNRSFTNTLKNLFDKKTTKPTISESDSQNEAYEFKLKNDNNEIPITQIEQKDEEKKIEKVEQEVNTKSTNDESNFVLNFDLKDSHQNSKVDLENDAIETSTKTSQNTQNITFPSLSALGLSADEEFDLVSDFIADTKESLKSIEQFIETNDFDNINYSLVKIKSSAEILNLDAIIDISNSIRKHCITKDVEKVNHDKERLSKQIILLEQHLEETAV